MGLETGQEIVTLGIVSLAFSSRCLSFSRGSGRLRGSRQRDTVNRLRHIYVLTVATLVMWAVVDGSGTLRAEQKPCYSCHKESIKKFDRRFKHDPVAKENCEACHVRHGFSNTLILQKKGKALCTSCHQDFDTSLTGLPQVHPAVKEELCTTCHDPHSSDRKGLIRNVDDDVACFVCHQTLADSTGHPKPHAPYAQRDCMACHVPHAGTQAKLLRASPDDVCQTCHNTTKTRADHQKRGLATAGLECIGCHDPHRSTRASLIGDRVHRPVGEGKCSACHAEPTPPATAVGPADSTWTGCKSCHDDIGRKLTAAVGHPPAESGDCYECHVAHRSSHPALLRGGIGELCQTCHEDMTAAKLAAAQSKHAPVAEGKCQACHDPHGSPNQHLLKKAGEELCLGCHTKDKFAKSEHLKTAGAACLDCHVPHSSEQVALLKEEPRATCGRCHKPKDVPGMVAHEPAKKQDCSACHDPHAGTGKANLRAEGPPLCFQCHQNIARLVAEPVKHPPVDDCLTCHGAHEAPNARLLVAKTGELCGGCHDVAVAGTSKSVHAPFADGDCTGCHNPHGSTVKKLLGPRRQMEQTPVGGVLRYPKVDSTAVSLCQTCHREKLAAWRDKPVQHKPFKDGTCNKCHAPHQADAEHLLTKAANAICQTCHNPADLKSAAHRGIDLSTANCASCHDPHASDQKALIRSRQHPPFAEGSCDVCHDAPGSTKLSEPQPQVCLNCHEDLERQLKLASVHAPARDGQCTACHNPHTSNNEKLLLADTTALCRKCHDLKPAGNLHAPFANGQCMNCHAPHGSAEPSLLVSASRQICLGCHQPLKNRLEKERPHAALDKGCLICHDGHSSTSPSLLKAPTVELCAKCHDTKAPRWVSSHQGGGTVNDCVSCHDPHSAPRETAALLKRVEHPPFAQRTCSVCHATGQGRAIKGNRELCGRCHAKVLAEIDRSPIPHPALADSGGCVVCHSPHTGNTPALLQKSGFSVCLTCHTSIRLTNTNVHPPAAEDCANCHTPHGGDNKFLLSEADVMTLCQQCHDDVKKTHFHPMGEGTKDPNRDGPVICTGCHSPHSSDHPSLLLGEPNRELCVRCHDPSEQHKTEQKKK